MMFEIVNLLYCAGIRKGQGHPARHPGQGPPSARLPLSGRVVSQAPRLSGSHTE